MVKCPKCGRLSVEWKPDLSAYACLWRDCLWLGQTRPTYEEEEASTATRRRGSTWSFGRSLQAASG
jgi:hypothetical protein